MRTLTRFTLDRACTIKPRSSATQACARSAADCGIRRNQSNSGLNDSIQTGIALSSRLAPRGRASRPPVGNSSTVEHSALTRVIQVRILVPQPIFQSVIEILIVNSEVRVRIGTELTLLRSILGRPALPVLTPPSGHPSTADEDQQRADQPCVRVPGVRVGKARGRTKPPPGRLLALRTVTVHRSM